MHRQEGFTLIELMIVILIIGILVGIAVPVFLAARGNAQAKSCLQNQDSFMAAADMFASETGDYPTSAPIAVGYVGSVANSTQIWPDGYVEGQLTANAPTCPGGGTVTVTYGATTDVRPSTSCDDHGNPKD